MIVTVKKKVEDLAKIQLIQKILHQITSGTLELIQLISFLLEFFLIRICKIMILKLKINNSQLVLGQKTGQNPDVLNL